MESESLQCCVDSKLRTGGTITVLTGLGIGKNELDTKQNWGGEGVLKVLDVRITDFLQCYEI